MTITAIAWRQLSVEERQQVSAMLQHHPMHGDWSTRDIGNTQGLDRPLFIAMAASVWPDEIRKNDDPATHPAWHYVDYPLRPPSFPTEAAPEPGNDILHGLAECQRLISDAAAPPVQRAEMICWLLHLIGDMHQPLHCAALMNADFPAPEGDRGGNLCFIRPKAGAEVINLHMFWDSQLGGGRTVDAPTAREALMRAIELEAHHPRRSFPELAQPMKVADWSLEGRAIAVRDVYLTGGLKYLPTKGVNAPLLPEHYAKTAKSVSERRASLAGHRLADMLRRVLAEDRGAAR